MIFKTLGEKITFLNKLVKGSLCMTCYAEWELGSYASDSLFCVDGVTGHVRGKNVTECVDKALRLAWEKIDNG
jgi:hypothetical protein